MNAAAVEVFLTIFGGATVILATAELAILAYNKGLYAKLVPVKVKAKA